MQAFDSPSINDFLSQLQMQSERALRKFQERKNQITSDFSRRGATMGSAHALTLLDAIDEHMEKGVSILLGELRRALQHPELDAADLRSLIGPRLDEFVTGICWGRPESSGDE